MILTIFSFGSDYASALVIHAMLAALVSLRRPYLIRSDGGRSVAGALTYAAALNFGPAGGVVIGAVATLGQSTEVQGTIPSGRLLARSAFGAAAGLLAGVTYTFIREMASPYSFPGQSAAIFLAAMACFLVLTASGLLESRRYVYHSLHERLQMSSFLSSEFALGIGVAAGVKVLHGLYAWEPMLLVMPIVYLAKQSLTDVLTAEKQTKIARHKLADLYLATIHSLIGAIDAKDRFTRQHTVNVAKLAVAIAHRMNLSHSEIEGLETAAMLHDVGKLGVPEHILLKPGKLDSEEFAKIRNHSALGQKILNTVDFPWPVGAMIRSHHERWDGTGYPDGLKGDEIPLGARILCAADVYDAMTSKRSYRPSNTPQEAIRYIRSASGTHFDPGVVRAFEHVIANGELPGVDRDAIGEAVDQAAAETSEAAGEKVMASLAEDISRASSEFIAMFEIAQSSSTSLNMSEVLSLLAGKIKSMIPSSLCAIFMGDEQSDKLHAKIAVGVNSPYFEGGRTSMGQGLTGMVAETGEGLIAEYDRNDVMLRQLFGQWIELRSVMIAPITMRDVVIGTINLYDTKQDAFSNEDLHLLTTVAPQVGKAIQNSLLFEETKESALTDILTGLHNSRFLFIRLEQELSRAKRLLKPVSVLGLDLDNFKLVNDTYGHQQGDVVLKEIGQLFLSQVRDYDLVCRYAGDEFIIVLPDADTPDGNETSQRIKSAIDEYKLPGAHNRDIGLGVSIGVATYPQDGQDVHTLIACADKRMYEDKEYRKRSAAAA
jgi:diguanylate cyclase (GGDEF)-like protein/putative nucleotidyltransferase with HDIG domain